MEVIVVDDGSTDGSAPFARSLGFPVLSTDGGSRGPAFATAVIPWHWAYYFYCGASFAAVALLQTLSGAWGARRGGRRAAGRSGQ